jgi:uridine kinase
MLVGFAGASGSGKTTLVQAVAEELEKVSEGATGDLIACITNFYQTLRERFGTSNLKIVVREDEE